VVIGDGSSVGIFIIRGTAIVPGSVHRPSRVGINLFLSRRMGPIMVRESTSVGGFEGPCVGSEVNGVNAVMLKMGPATPVGTPAFPSNGNPMPTLIIERVDPRADFVA